MVLYTIGIFFLYLMWSGGGFLMHIFLDLATAKRTKKNFKLSTFWDRNVFIYLYSIMAIVLSCGLLACSPSQIKELPDLHILGISISYQIWLVVIGYTGGAMLKKFLKKKESM